MVLLGTTQQQCLYMQHSDDACRSNAAPCCQPDPRRCFGVHSPSAGPAAAAAHGRAWGPRGASHGGAGTLPSRRTPGRWGVVRRGDPQQGHPREHPVTRPGGVGQEGPRGMAVATSTHKGPAQSPRAPQGLQCSQSAPQSQRAPQVPGKGFQHPKRASLSPQRAPQPLAEGASTPKDS